MTRKTTLFEGCSWFKFNNLGLGLSMAMKFYTSVAHTLKPKIRIFLRKFSTFVEVTWEKLVERPFRPNPSWIRLTEITKKEQILQIKPWINKEIYISYGKQIKFSGNIVLVKMQCKNEEIINQFLHNAFRKLLSSQKKDTLTVSSYRPISLSSVFSKIF